MARHVRYHPLFDSDVIAAANWYDERSPGLGDAFVTDARQAAEAAISSPELHSRTPLGLRYFRVQRFPYYILYQLTNDEILMLGVLHTARSINKWLHHRG